MKTLMLTLLFAGLCTGLAFAQSPWINDTHTSSITLEWDKPIFDERTFDRSEVSAASSAMFLTGRMLMTDNIVFVAELPISHFGYKNGNPFGGDDNSTMIGNLYAGGIYNADLRNPDNHLFVELGVRIPTAKSPNDDRFGNFTGMMSEASDRMEAFLWDTWSIPVIGSFVTPITGPFDVKLRLGTAYNIYTGDFEDLDNTLHLLYGVTALYRDVNTEAYIGFSGRNPYAGNDPDFFEDGFTQLRAGVALPFRNIVPGVYVRKPLGENFNQLVDFSFGFTLEFRR
jgi:hypothetical protein